MDDAPTRTLVVHCADWSLTVAGVGRDDAAIAVRANRVVAASAPAREAGITIGLRRREAQRRCPHVAVLAPDPPREARAFEVVAAALDALTPRVEVTEPGTIAFATRGPSRYFGGDAALARRAARLVVEAAGPAAQVRIGVADGAFAALLAARRAGHAAAGIAGVADEPGSLVVPPGATPAFLAGYPVRALSLALHEPDLLDVWHRLGLRTLAALAALPPADVLARFGPPGIIGHRLASGLDARPLDARRPAPERAVTQELDPPADTIDRVAFPAKVLADALHAGLATDGLACTQVAVEAETEHGEVLVRHWRHEGALDAGAVAERVRWQLDGWLSGSARTRPSAGIVRLTLVPAEIVAARGRQLGFWGGETLVDERVLRAVARVQGLLGADAVTVPEVVGGRGPAERIARVSVGAVDLTAPRSATRPDAVEAPWPGTIPAPAPAVVAGVPEAVEVVDAEGEPVRVTGRAEVSAPPHRLRRSGGRQVGLAAWAGPWPVDERWWDPARHRRRARFQVVDDAGCAHLLAVEAGRWWLEASYD